MKYCLAKMELSLSLPKNRNGITDIKKILLLVVHHSITFTEKKLQYYKKITLITNYTNL